ncbi:unnamed protein product [Cochlearia groenlandica]
MLLLKKNLGRIEDGAAEESMNRRNWSSLLEKLVVENILAFDEVFWIRLATRSDTCISDDDKASKDYEELAATVMSIVDCVVNITREKIDSSTDVLKGILRPVVEGVEEITWPPIDPDAINQMEKEIIQREKEGKLDEGFLSEVSAQLRQAKEDKDKPGLAAMLQKVLQLYAATVLSKRSYAKKGNEVVKAEHFLETLIKGFFCNLLKEDGGCAIYIPDKGKVYNLGLNLSGFELLANSGCFKDLTDGNPETPYPGGWMGLFSIAVTRAGEVLVVTSYPGVERLKNFSVEVETRDKLAIADQSILGQMKQIVMSCDRPSDNLCYTFMFLSVATSNLVAPLLLPGCSQFKSSFSFYRAKNAEIVPAAKTYVHVRTLVLMNPLCVEPV